MGNGKMPNVQSADLDLEVGIYSSNGCKVVYIASDELRLRHEALRVAHEAVQISYEAGTIPHEP